MNIVKGFRELMASKFRYSVLAVMFTLVEGAVVLLILGMGVKPLGDHWWLALCFVVAGILTSVGIWLGDRDLRKRYPGLQ